MLTNLMMYFVFVIAGHFLIKSNGLFGFLHATSSKFIHAHNNFLLRSMKLKIKILFINYSKNDLFPSIFINFVANIDALIQRY